MRRHGKWKLREVLAKNVRHERTRRHWSQEKLGEMADLSQVYISQVEAGMRALSIDSIEKIAGALQIPAFELIRSGQTGR